MSVDKIEDIFAKVETFIDRLDHDEIYVNSNAYNMVYRNKVLNHQKDFRGDWYYEYETYNLAVWLTSEREKYEYARDHETDEDYDDFPKRYFAVRYLHWINLAKNSGIVQITEAPWRRLEDQDKKIAEMKAENLTLSEANKKLRELNAQLSQEIEGKNDEILKLEDENARLEGR